MNILKPLLIISLFLFSKQLMAQDFYLLGGTNISTLSELKDKDNLDRTKQLGFQIGGLLDLPIGNRFYLSPQASFALKRERSKSNIVFYLSDGFTNNYQTIQIESQINNYYIDLPITIKYKFSLTSIDIYPFVGPYASYLLFNNSNSKMYINDEPYKPDFEIEGKKINNLDYGISTGIGLNSHSLLVNLAVDWGLNREMKYENFKSDEKFKNTVVKLNFGFKL